MLIFGKIKQKNRICKIGAGGKQGNRIKILGDKQRWRCVNDDRCREIL